LRRTWLARRSDQARSATQEAKRPDSPLAGETAQAPQAPDFSGAAAVGAALLAAGLAAVSEALGSGSGVLLVLGGVARGLHQISVQTLAPRVRQRCSKPAC